MKALLTMFAVCLSLFSLTVMAEEEETNKHSIIIKAGSYTLSSGSQTTFGGTSKFDEDASGVFGGEFTWKMKGMDDVRFGGELLFFSNDYSTNGFKGEVSSLAIMLNVRKYFLEGDFKPFVAGGIGAMSSSFDGFYSGSAGGLAMQFLLGAQYNVSNDFSLYAEYKNIFSADVDAEVKDSSEKAEFDMSGSGLFAGVAIHF